MRRSRASGFSLLAGLDVRNRYVVSPAPTAAAPQWASFTPPLWTLGPIQGADGKERTVLNNFDKIQAWSLPITVFHFDAPTWMSCTGNAQFGYSSAVLDRMRSQNIRGLFWLGLSPQSWQRTGLERQGLFTPEDSIDIARGLSRREQSCCWCHAQCQRVPTMESRTSGTSNGQSLLRSFRNRVRSG